MSRWLLVLWAVLCNWTDNAVQVNTSADDCRPEANFLTDPFAVTFDFENAPIHTSLPIDLTVAGTTAHFSATGQGFSIQRADTMGFTPAGFSGLCIYPNSVFAADLLVSFSETLSDFSVMYAPQELGCDTSATMRVTAYMNGAWVGTNTATAPQPGTWPTGTLSIQEPAGFNSVVVHFEARGTNCEDWGPIFMADNMIVRRFPRLGDFNGDGWIDLLDFEEMAACLAGPDIFAPPAGCDAVQFARDDLDHDGDVDLADFAIFQAVFPLP